MKTKMKFTTLALSVMALLSSDLKAQDGSLDLSFGSGGKVTTVIGNNGNVSAYAMALQPDGKILLAGYAMVSGSNDFGLARYNTDGTLDTSFDTDGTVTTSIGSLDCYAQGVAVQSDGKILLAGQSSNGTDTDFTLVRYNSDGSLDLTFDTDGIVITAVGSFSDYANAISLQPDGKILLAGRSTFDFALVRYNIDGSLDLTFDTDGKVTTFIGNDATATAMTLQPDGKILLAGYSYNGANNDFALARYNSNGSLDLTFDTDGKVTTAIGNANDAANAISLQPDGKILLAGYSTATNDNFALARYNSNGSLDLTFDTDGKVTTTIGSSAEEARAISLLPNGKILLAGNSYNGTNQDFALVRYNSNGNLDFTFDTDGKVTTGIGNSDDVAYAMSIQPDGKILLGGYSFDGISSSDFALVRYNNTITTINTIQDQPQSITIYPNPFSDATTIQFPLTTTDAELSIYNMFGQKVKTISNISDTKISLNRDELSNGFYVLRLTQNKKVVATGRMVVVD